MTHYSNMTDETLAKLSQSNEQAFYFLIKRYEKRLLAYISRSVGCPPEQSEDILQEVFIKLYKHLNGFDTALKFSSWVYRIAHNECVDFYRKNKRHLSWERSDTTFYAHGLPGIISETVDISEQILSEEKSLALKKILFSLPPEYKDIIILKYLEEKDYSDISDILKIPLGTVATRLNRAKKKLKTLIVKKYKWIIENE